MLTTFPVGHVSYVPVYRIMSREGPSGHKWLTVIRERC